MYPISRTIKNAFTVVLYGGRALRDKRNPINMATNIDKLTLASSDDETITLADVLVDEEAQRPFSNFEEVIS